MKPSPALAPLGWLYLRAARLRDVLYRRGWLASERVEIPVVCVGNLTAGGTGKTPAVAWLAARLGEAGWRVAIVSRGYGGAGCGGPLLVGRDGLVVAEAALAGDEPVQLARAAAAPLVVVGARRAEAVRFAARHGAELAVLDDGFQHRRLAREFDLVLLDAADPFGGGRGLPAGLLREPPGALARAGAILLTRAPDDLLRGNGWLDLVRVPAAVREALLAIPERERPPVASAAHRARRLALPDGSHRPPEWLAGRRVLAVSAIARPDTFEALLGACGAQVVDRLAWRDHHAFTAADAAEIRGRAPAPDAGLVVTTAKDVVRWPAAAPPPAVLEVELQVPAAQLLLERIGSALERHADG
ncbi:MAG: tetraacyldisaccharide 4'-kinase [Acidobacteria bacterium]|nr:tetraacyldisaccharide 4'-kinase [Acidobacteriota bacterium]